MVTAAGAGTKADPWKLRTPPGTSEYQMCTTRRRIHRRSSVRWAARKLCHQRRCVDDLHTMLKQPGDWVPLGGADEQKPAPEGSVEAWGRSPDNPVGGWCVAAGG